MRALRLLVPLVVALVCLSGDAQAKKKKTKAPARVAPTAAPVREAFPTVVLLGELMLLNHRAHSTVDDQDALTGGGFECLGALASCCRSKQRLASGPRIGRLGSVYHRCVPVLAK